MHYYLDALKKYAVFKGRASREEYRVFIFTNLITIFIIFLVIGAIQYYLNIDLRIILVILVLALLIPSSAVSVRRMHDLDRGALDIEWYNLFVNAKVFGLIFNEGTKGNNRFGAEPKKY